jgi:fermentation-respiration switch protein FrsA (DUF1100 family)
MYLLRMLVLLLVCSYAALVILALLSDRVIFLPHASSYRDSDLIHVLTPGADPVQIVKVSSGHVWLTGIYLPNAKADYTLLFSHGNAEDLGDDLPMLEEFRAAGFAVFAYDYRGYGTSPGRPSEPAMYQDVASAYDYLTRTLCVPPDRVISFGRSLGSAAAIQLAVDRPVAGLIVEAPFLSAFRVLTRAPLLPWDKFRNAEKIKNVHCPVLVIHGRSDRVVPFWHGERLFAIANNPKQAFWVERAGHNDAMYVAGPAYLHRFQEFARSLSVPSARTGRGL